MTNLGSFHSLYCCNVKGFNFSIIHKLEGKWSGDAFFLGDEMQNTEKHASSTKLVYNNAEECWSEKQMFTSRDGLSTGRTFKYVPHAHGSLYVENEDTELMEEAIVKLQEIGSNIIILSAINTETGQIIVTETTSPGVAGTTCCGAPMPLRNSTASRRSRGFS